MHAKTPSISIMVSCHKPTLCPDSPVFKPIQLGASRASEPIAGMQPDNEGDNISDRNSAFCELTAQYWGWKHLESDYIGLCHYRRYFCFDGKEHSKNDHAQIEIPCLSDAAIQEYRLGDTRLIEETVCQYDAVIPEIWSVENVPTPLGPQATIKEHMIAYGLFDESAINMLINICSKRQPTFLHYLKKYLDGSQYQGYNCFIMKRSLFEELCEFEFDILLAFDKTFDYRNLTSTRKRIIGYLGEILISTFFNRLDAERQCSIAHYPLTFFENTPAPASLDYPSRPGEIPLVWRLAASENSLASFAVETFIQFEPSITSGPATLIASPENYDRITAAGKNGADGIRIKYATWPVIEHLPLNRFLLESDLYVILPLLLPWIINDSKRALWGDGCLLFNSAPQWPDASESYAINNIFLQRELNKPQNRKLTPLFGGNRVGALPGSELLMLNLESLRKEFCLDDVIELFHIVKQRIRKFSDAFAPNLDAKLSSEILIALMLQQLGFQVLPFDTATYALHKPDTLTWANDDSVHTWQSTASPSVIVYCKDVLPNLDDQCMYANEFWKAARKTCAYESLITEKAVHETLSADAVKDMAHPRPLRERAAGLLRKALSV